MKKKYKSGLILVILIYLLFIFLVDTSNVVEKILSYTDLFIKRVFPVSFAFLSISYLLIEYNFISILQRIFHIKSPYIYVFLLSLISGFPSGAIYIKELLEKDVIDYDDANKMILFCHFPNPLFVINSIGIILNKYLSFIILISIILSNFILLLFCIRKKNYYTNINQIDDFSSILSKCIYHTFKTIILIFGISLFFYIISFSITKYINNTYIYIIINGLFDLTNGVYSTSIIKNNLLKAIFIIFFISFGSLSIHFQTKSILSNTNVKYSNYLFGRIIGFILTITIFIILFLV